MSPCHSNFRCCFNVSSVTPVTPIPACCSSCLLPPVTSSCMSLLSLRSCFSDRCTFVYISASIHSCHLSFGLHTLTNAHPRKPEPNAFWIASRFCLGMPSFWGALNELALQVIKHEALRLKLMTKCLFPFQHQQQGLVGSSLLPLQNKEIPPFPSTRTKVHTCIHTHRYIHASISCACACTHIRVHTHTHTHARTHTHTYTHTHARADTHTHTHAH